MINCMIVDDHQEAIDVLEIHFKSIQDISLSAKFTNPLEALSYLEKNSVDLIFLDVEMPNFNGIDFIENLKAKHGMLIPKVIFTTGHHGYAISGFDKGVTDYLLKPVSLSRLKLAIDRLRAGAGKVKEDVPVNSFFFVESDNKKVRINFSDIVYVEAAGNYVTIALKEKKYTVHMTLTSLWNSLPEKDFIRTHKSFIIAVSGILALSGTELVVNNGPKTRTIPIGATYKESVLKRLKLA
jgi:DNA-binding LytR/AlgR family response regulator